MLSYHVLQVTINWDEAEQNGQTFSVISQHVLRRRKGLPPIPILLPLTKNLADNCTFRNEPSLILCFGYMVSLAALNIEQINFSIPVDLNALVLHPCLTCFNWKVLGICRRPMILLGILVIIWPLIWDTRRKPRVATVRSLLSNEFCWHLRFLSRSVDS